MIVNLAFKYELDPNDRQRTSLARHAGVSRFAYNWALAKRIQRLAAFEGKERFTNAMADHREWNVWKWEGAPFAQEVSKCAPQEAFRDLDRAFSNYFSGRKGGRKVGFPKFRKKGCHDSFRLTGSIRVGPQFVQLPRLGRLRTKEATAVEGRVLSATVTTEADRWFVSVTVEVARPDPPERSGGAVGIDVGLASFAVTSDGDVFTAPKPLGRALKRLRRLARRQSRKSKGSRNCRKSSRRIAKLHWQIGNQRRDFLHKITSELAKTKPTLVIEQLNVAAMLRNRHLSRHVADVGWGEFRRMLTYKCAWYGAKLIHADRFFPSSKTCSVCTTVVRELPKKTRSWTCATCGVEHDRDLNAAKNLAKYGTARLAETAGVMPETPVDDPSVGGTAMPMPVYEARFTGTRKRTLPPGR